MRPAHALPVTCKFVCRLVRGGSSGAMAMSFVLLLLLALVAWVAEGAPLEADFSTCRPVTLDVEEEYNCCTLHELIHQPPVVKDYQTYLKQTKFSNDRIRVRPAAHLVSEEYAEKLNRAFQLLRELPADDPRSWIQQSNLHCLYGHPWLRDQKNSTADYGIHKNWLLMPFHRWYMYFYERILGTLVGDLDFALPYWNWDNQSPVEPLANCVPAIFNDPVKYPALYDAVRDMGNTMGKSIINLSYKTSFDMPVATDDEIRELNSAFLHQILVHETKDDKDILFSYPQRAGEDTPYYAGYFESGPHGAIHFWSGDNSLSHKEDMGSAYTAARDPVFFGHHGNVDRLWDVWRSLGRENYDDPDWYNAEFVLYDEMGDLVKVKVSDSIDSKKLGYVYQEVENAWLNYDMSKNPNLSQRVVGMIRRQAQQPGKPQPKQPTIRETADFGFGRAFE